MTKRSAARVEFLSDVLTTAVEGGINYWASVSAYRWDTPNPDEIGVTVHVDDEDDWPTEGKRVTLDTIAHGIAVLKASGGPSSPGEEYPGSYWKEFLLADRTNGEDGDYDAGIADCILQAGLFDKIVYG